MCCPILTPHPLPPTTSYFDQWDEHIIFKVSVASVPVISPKGFWYFFFSPIVLLSLVLSGRVPLCTNWELAAFEAESAESVVNVVL